jgi:uncharacterized protein
MSQTVIYAFALILLALGVPMAFVPMLPALSYMFVVALAFAFVTHFATISIEGILGLLGVTLVSVVIDHTSGLLGAKYGGAHGKSLMWGMLGAIIGTFVFPIFGSFIGLFLGVLVAELHYKKRLTPDGAALKAASGAVMGSIAGVAVNIAIAVVFLASFALVAWR